MQWYNFKFKALPVTTHLLEDKKHFWQRIVGFQIGDWFIGAIKGHTAQPYEYSEDKS